VTPAFLDSSPLLTPCSAWRSKAPDSGHHRHGSEATTIAFRACANEARTSCDRALYANYRDFTPWRVSTSFRSRAGGRDGFHMPPRGVFERPYNEGRSASRLCNPTQIPPARLTRRGMRCGRPSVAIMASSSSQTRCLASSSRRPEGCQRAGCVSRRIVVVGTASRSAKAPAVSASERVTRKR